MMTMLARRWFGLLILATLAFAPGCKSLGARQASVVQAQNMNTASWLKAAAYQSLDEYPTLAAPGNEIVTFMIRVGDTSHTAMAVGNDFYDFGPVGDEDGTGSGREGLSIRSGPGGRYWSGKEWTPENQPTRLINYNESLKHLVVSPDKTVVLIPIEVTKEHAENIRTWWDTLYKSHPRFSIPGLHCTSTAIRSFETSDPAFKNAPRKLLGRSKGWSPGWTSPTSFVEKLLTGKTLSSNGKARYEQIAGPSKGQALKVLVAVVGKDLGRYGVTPVAPIRETFLKINKGLNQSYLRDKAAAAAQSDPSSDRDSRDAAPAPDATNGKSPPVLDHPRGEAAPAR